MKTKKIQRIKMTTTNNLNTLKIERIFLALTFSCFVAIGFSQSYEDYIFKADSLYNTKNYEKSCSIYTKALDIKQESYSDYYNAACSCALANDKKSAYNFLEKSATLGWKNLNHIKSDKDLENIRNTEKWENIIKIVEANKKEYEKNFNIPLKNQLEDIMVRDQTFRLLYEEAEKIFAADSKEMQFFWKTISEHDSINEAEVVEILDKYGWVGKSEVGGEANMALWLVIQHADIDIQEKYLPLMEASVKKGESQGSQLAMLHDRILMRNGKPQKYGSQITYNEQNKPELYKLENPKKVNEWRASVGLPPLEDYLKHWNITWQAPE